MCATAFFVKITGLIQGSARYSQPFDQIVHHRKTMLCVCRHEKKKIRHGD